MENDTKGRLIYLGLTGSFRAAQHLYREVTPENELGETWRFGSQLFKRASIGTVYDVTYKNEGKSVSYNSGDLGTCLIEAEEGKGVSTFILFKEELDSARIDTQVIKEAKKAKNQETEFEEILQKLNAQYRNNHHSNRTAFLAYCINKITK